MSQPQGTLQVASASANMQENHEVTETLLQSDIDAMNEEEVSGEEQSEEVQQEGAGNEDDELSELTDEEAEAQGFSKGVQKRINKLTKNWRETQRLLRDAQSKSSDTEALWATAREHNEALRRTLETFTNAVEGNKETAAQTEYQNKINSLEAEKRAALDSLDTAKALSISEQLSDMKLKRLQDEYKQSLEAVQAQRPAQPHSEDGILPETRVIVAQNSDIFKHPNESLRKEMTDYATFMEYQLMRDPQYANDVAGRLIEAVNKTRNFFASKLGNSQSPTFNSMRSMTMGVGNMDTNTSSKPTLTADEKKVARMMFPDIPVPQAEKDYLEQKILIERGH